MEQQVAILVRKRTIILTDPQRRVYDGHMYRSEEGWTAWGTLEVWPESVIERRLKFWRELNEYAVKERGKWARWEFKATPLLSALDHL